MTKVVACSKCGGLGVIVTHITFDKKGNEVRHTKPCPAGCRGGRVIIP